MQAMVRSGYGAPEEVMALQAVPRPPIKEDEVLINVKASSTNTADWLFLTGDPLFARLLAGPIRPRHEILGKDVAGVIEAVGSKVIDFSPGDEIYGEIEFGAWAEYAATKTDVIARKPTNLTFEQAAAVPLAGITALQGLRDRGRLQAGDRVLINGASGGNGTFAVQIAKALGAEVTGVASTANLELVRSLGADHVIDYTTTDVTATDDRYDVIFDVAGSHPVAAMLKLLADGGRYLPVGGPIGRLLRAALSSMLPGSPITVLSATPNRADLETLTGFIESGALAPVIDHRYGLRDLPQAMRLQGAGHAQGKRVIAM